MDISLVRYIEYCTKKGIPKETIKQSLVHAGWKEAVVDQALGSRAAQPSTKKPLINLKMWTGPIILSVILLAFTNLYNFFYFESLTTRSMVEATAAAAALMIGISFALSSMSYYFDFLDTKLAYRKEIGLIGYYLALAYSILLAINRPEMYISGFLKNFLTADVILGLSAMTILTAMTIVSINKVMVKVTPAVSRKILRLGYLAYFLLILRAIAIQRETWLDWFASLNGPPPARLVISFFAAFVIILRFTMALSIFIKDRKKAGTQASPAN